MNRWCFALLAVCSSSIAQDSILLRDGRVLSSVAAGEQCSITGKAQIRQDGAWTWLEATDGTNSFKTSWVRPPVELTPDAEYTFLVEFYKHIEPFIEKILQGGKIIFDSSICELHGVSMRKEEVPRDYGYGGPRPYRLPVNEQPSFQTIRQQFPNYIEIAYGGCVDWGDRSVMIYRCGKCKTAFVEWRAQAQAHQR